MPQVRTTIRRAVSAAQFERRLLQTFPEWRRFARYREQLEQDGVTRGYLVVAVPSANPAVSEPLRIDTDTDSIIVSWFGGLHNHFDWQRDYIADAIAHIRAILADQVIYTVSTSGGGSITRSWHGARDRVIPGDTSR